MEYSVAFDASQAGYHDWTFAVPGLLFIAIGIGVVHYRELLRPMTARPLRGIFPFLFLGFAIIWTVLAFGTTYLHDVRARDALRNGNAQMLEGTVSHFTSIPNGEGFVLEGRKFSYSDYLGTGCFNNMKSHGGPMHDGARVRLWAIHNCILKLEIAGTGNR